MADVFLSYSRKDESLVRRLDAALASRDREVWVDWEDIPPTAEWWTEVERGIETADALLFVISPTSARSAICARELSHALLHGKRVIPVVAEDVDPAALPPGLAEINWIFLRPTDDFEAALSRLTSALDTDLERARAHTRLLTRAVEWDARGRDRNLVLRGSDLEDAERFMALGALDPPRPTPLQGEYVSAGRNAATRRRRLAGGVGALVLTGLVVLSLVALLQRSEAIDQRRAAESRELSASALLALSEDPELSLLLARRAADVEPTDQAVDALRQALVASHMRIRLPSGGESVGSAGFSPDGSRVVTLANGGAGAVWDAGSGRRIASLRGHAGKAVAASFSGDGERVLTAAQDGTLRVWDAASGRELAKLRNEHNGYFENRLVGARFSPDGRLVVSWEFPGESVVLWDWQRGSIVRELPDGGGEDAVFSPDGRALAVSDQDGTAALSDVASGRSLGRLRVPGAEGLAHVAFTPDGRRVVAAARQAAVWEVRGGRRLHVFPGHSAAVRALDVSADGTLLATGSEDRTARVWDLESGRELQILRGHADVVTDVAFRDDAKYLATTSRDGSVRVWEVATGNPVSELRGHNAAVSGVEWHRGGSRLLTWAAEGTVRIWDAGVGEPIRTRAVRDPPEGEYFVSDRQPGERYYATAVGGEDHGVRIFDARNDRELRAEDLPFVPQAVVFAPSGDRVVVLGSDAGETLLGTIRGALKPLAVERAPLRAAFDASGERVVVTEDDGRALLFEAGSGRPLVTFERHRGRVREQAGFAGEVEAAFSPDGRTVATTDVFGSAWLWRAADGKPIRHVTSSEPWERMPGASIPAFSPDGRLVAMTWNWEDTVHLWRTANGARVTDLAGTGTFLLGASFAPSGPLLVASTGEGTARVWDTTSGRSLRTFRSANDLVYEVGFSTDGAEIIAYSVLGDGGTVETFACEVCGSTERLRKLAGARTTRDFTPLERARYLHE